MPDEPRQVDTSVFDADWAFAPATSLDCGQWSFGTVTSVPDLYSHNTFGPPWNFRCECGNYAGKEFVGRICHQCGVIVTADAARDRRRRMAKLKLACSCKHPLEDIIPASRFAAGVALLDHFPICPVAYRTDAQGRPNALGDRYERLVGLNQRTAALLPPEGDPDFIRATLQHDPSDLVAAMRAILGFNRDPAMPAADEDTLLPLLLRALFGCDPDAAPLARSCLLTVRLRARI